MEGRACDFSVVSNGWVWVCDSPLCRMMCEWVRVCVCGRARVCVFECRVCVVRDLVVGGGGGGGRSNEERGGGREQGGVEEEG